MSSSFDLFSGFFNEMKYIEKFCNTHKIVEKISFRFSFRNSGNSNALPWFIFKKTQFAMATLLKHSKRLFLFRLVYIFLDTQWFFVLPSSAYMNKSGFLMRERATYN